MPPKGPRKPLRSAHHGPKPPSPAPPESVSDPLDQPQVAPGRGEAPRYRGGHVALGGAKVSGVTLTYEMHADVITFEAE